MDEKILIQQLKQPATRREAFEKIVVQYQKKVYGIVRKMVIDHDDADDLVQEVFIKVWNNIENFKGDAQLFTWIYRIATNESLGFLRKKKRFTWFSDEVNERLVNALTTNLQLSGDEIQLKLQKAILKLPDKQRLVFNLKYYEDFSYEEIAAITETSIGGLKASYHHAVKKIEEFIERD